MSGAPFAGEHCVERRSQAVKIGDVVGGVGELLFAQLWRAPVGTLLFLRQIDAQKFADQIFQSMLVGVGARQSRGDFGAIDGRDRDAQVALERAHVEARKVKQLGNASIRQQPREVGRANICIVELHRVADVVSRRELDQAQPVAERVEAERLGVDGDGRSKIKPVGQIAVVEFDFHAIVALRCAGVLVPRRGLEPPRLAALVPETSASTNSAIWARAAMK